MAKLIKVKNPYVPVEEETFLTSSYTSGTSLTVENNEGWANNDIAIIGQPGNEKTESTPVTGTSSSDTITLQTAYNFDHSENTPLFKTGFNYVSLERKPSGGSFAEIAEGIHLIEWDERDGFTKITVAAGVDSDTFRWRFYNNRTGGYSGYSAELPGTGLTAYHAGFIIASIRRDAKIPANLAITDKDIMEWLNDGQRDIDTRHERWWFALTQDTSVTRKQAIAGTYQYDLPDSFRGMDVVKALDSNSMLYNLSFVPLIEFDLLIQDQSTAQRDDGTMQWTLLPPDSSNTVGYFGVYPIPETTTNYFYRRYWRFLPELTSFASRTLIPIPQTLYNYGMHRVYKRRGDDDRANQYWEYYLANVELLRKAQKRQIGQSEFQRFRGQRGYSKLFGSLNGNYSDSLRENYW